MCGISGVITNNKEKINEILEISERVQIHRGPDIQDKKIFNIGDWGLGFGHQRLSILDLSEAGKQPMYSASSNSLIIYNGEVYNYKELITESLDHVARTGTDTEVVLEILERYGVEVALQKFNGMWAFAWIDIEQQKLYLARDRVGIKPLYYYHSDNTFIFSSEIKTILEASGEQFSLNHQAVGEYLMQSLQDTSDNSFFSEIHTVPAGHYLEIDLSKPALELKFTRYWNVLDAEPYSGDNLVGHVKELFNDSVKLRMRSDVPVAVTLSGGLDSSSIASSMKQYLGTTGQLNILSVVSPGSNLDESEFIDEMADYLHEKVNKVELNWSASEAVSLLKKVTWHNDSPVGSFSNVAHYLMMKKAKELGVTVILSGQGADEILCGYKKYLGFYLQYLVRTSNFIKATKVFFGFVINRSVINQFNIMEAKRYLPKWFQKLDIDIRGEKLKEYYRPLSLKLKTAQTMQQRQAEDLEALSVPFLTHYEDRMSMAWSREIRLPFLDYRLIELFINLPTHKKLKLGWTKYILRQAMDSMLPHKINWRKDKQGFVNPQEEWLKNELKPEVLKAFSETALIFQLGLIDRGALIQKYDAFCTQSETNGKVWYRDIFAPFALEVWLQLNKKYLIFN
jgi:asparagine synthase (glutamine-hydrolysing)